MSDFIYLASASARRAELLAQIGVNYKLLPQDINEQAEKNETAKHLVSRLAHEKAHQALNHILKQQENNTDSYALAPVLGADTILLCQDRILTKPVDQDDAVAMLNLLSDNHHQVLTAVTICDQHKSLSALCISDVRFRKLSATEIDFYVTTEDVFDKAGAYAIQGKAAIFVAHISGSYSNIKGLPLFETDQLLRHFN